DPYLKYKPPFVRSLPVQILLTGIVLTLVAVLFIHLIFTAQYHWPLAPVNYVLQLSGVTTLLISLIATLHVVLSTTMVESQHWPYMLSYIAVNVPPLDVDYSTTEWSTAERATWLVMNASTSGLIQITHIQFLTLLYPSRLEGRLIFALLGPLALVAAVMQLIPIQAYSDTDSKVLIIAAAVRNVCNATLSLLFTAALFVWGLLVNRKQAWRTDGGTAAFGTAALVLALVSTALNFLYVDREEEYVWLPGLMWAVILWQSFLGWWWWVGAGSGSGFSTASDALDIKERLQRKEKRESRRREAKERRNVTKLRAKKMWRDVAGAFGHRAGDRNTSASPPRRRDQTTEVHNPHVPPRSHATAGSLRSNDQSETASSSATSTTVTTSATTLATLPRILPVFIHRWYASLRRAHLAAAHQQEVERVERIREFEERHQGAPTGRGWGLGSFGWRMPSDLYSNRISRTVENERWKMTTRGRRRRKEGEEGNEPNEVQVDENKQWARHETDQAHATPLSTTTRNTHLPTTSSPASHSRSIWWWGPLRRWRLQDSTIY
ncbi:hypothetical protein AMATHDRAFT_140740, partial [Amanita thiersii Skay4041]